MAMRALAGFLLVASLTPAAAVPITVTFSDADQQTLAAALDAYAKANGGNALIPGAIILQELQQALKTANSIPPPPTSPTDK